MTAKLTFHGGTGTVTGANFLVETDTSAFLVDCGLQQGGAFSEEVNRNDFTYNPALIPVLLVTHAHTDHIGRIPQLVKRGFAGAIYSTPPTKDIAGIMFEDALKIMREEAEEEGKEPLYDEHDIATALALWNTHSYHEPFTLPDGVTVQFLNAGHILGSAMIECTRNGKKLLFSGDLGNTPAPIVQDTEPVSDISYMVMESVYGDRVHEHQADRLTLLRQAIEDTRKKKGTLLIPAFSLQRTQSILHDLNHLFEHGHVAQMPVYLDAPLAIKVMDTYRMYAEYFNETLQAQIRAGDDPFSFDNLTLTPEVRDSERAMNATGPKIIVAGSGMSHGGRIRAHEKHSLGDKNTTVLFVGYQTVGSLGRRIQEGNKKVRIDNEWVRVRASVVSISGYSAHKDRDQLIDFVAQTSYSLKQVFVVMGEPKSALFLTQRLRDFLSAPAVAPDQGQSFVIEW